MALARGRSRPSGPDPDGLRDAAGVAGPTTPRRRDLFVLEVVGGSFSMMIFGPAVVSASFPPCSCARSSATSPCTTCPLALGSALEFVPFLAIV